MTDAETLSAYAQNVEKYAALVESEKPGKALKDFLSAVKPGGVVLDLGCGPGNSSAQMQAMGFQTVSTDASPEMVQTANDTYGLNATVATFDDLSQVDEFDGVWANFSLLHAPKADFPRYLTAIHTALRPKGGFHIGMKLGTGEKRDRLGRFYAYYCVDELENLLHQSGFEPFVLREGEEAGLAGDIDPWATILSRKLF